MVIIRPARSHGGCRNLEDEPALTISTEMQKISTRELDRKGIRLVFFLFSRHHLFSYIRCTCLGELLLWDQTHALA